MEDGYGTIQRTTLDQLSQPPVIATTATTSSDGANKEKSRLLGITSAAAGRPYQRGGSYHHSDHGARDDGHDELSAIQSHSSRMDWISFTKGALVGIASLALVGFVANTLIRSSSQKIVLKDEGTTDLRIWASSYQDSYKAHWFEQTRDHFPTQKINDKKDDDDKDHHRHHFPLRRRRDEDNDSDKYRHKRHFSDSEKEKRTKNKKATDSDTTTGTWLQRYFAHGKFFGGPGHPIFVMVGGEDEVDGLVYPFIYRDLAKLYQAYSFRLEHRFYGPSLPVTGRSPTNEELKRLLTPAQALADLAEFIRYQQHQLGCSIDKTSKHYCPVMTVGGSYPGFLSAMMRTVYPDVVDIGYAGSAPLLLYSHDIGSNAYYDKVTAVTEEASPGCPAAVRNALYGLKNQALGITAPETGLISPLARRRQLHKLAKSNATQVEDVEVQVVVVQEDDADAAPDSSPDAAAAPENSDAAEDVETTDSGSATADSEADSDSAAVVPAPTTTEDAEPDSDSAAVVPAPTTTEDSEADSDSAAVVPAPTAAPITLTTTPTSSATTSITVSTTGKPMTVRQVAKKLNLCLDTIPHYIQTPDTLIEELNMIVVVHFADDNMGYYPPGPTSYLNEHCDIFLQPNNGDAVTDFTKIRDFLFQQIEDGKPGDCFDLQTELPPGPHARISASDWSGVGGGPAGLPWDFQTCMFASECGFSEQSMFLPRPWTWEWITGHCRRRFDYTPHPDTLVKQFHFDTLTGVKRLLFTNGLNDGWSIASILETPPDSEIVVINFPNGAHHSDLTWVGPSDERDTEDIKAGHVTITNLVGQWLNEIKTENKKESSNHNVQEGRPHDDHQHTKHHRHHHQEE